ncbi:N-acetylglucosamine kinase [Erwinia sp. HR93]|uniref:N-acetylglucosamine kinase n=1 Tax=Erwinia sp. HR93 TaxID=3094840 RepID=UPI002ADEAB3B|nr:N-acetylglucosamine kinase [Erwinia sp. HR93]MEA1064840.1 N-acetylglucosamine kinase [Erwinia sp. HR93]
MYYGFDIGGSKIALGVYNSQRQLLQERRIATPHDDYHRFIQAIIRLVTEMDAQYGEAGSVGIGIPGTPRTAQGLLYAANLPAASGHPLAEDLSRLLTREVRIENDANCFALSEAWDDEFRSAPVVMGLILGTGMGGGLVVNGRIVSGYNGLCAEFGHMRLPVDALEILGADIPLIHCACGQRGCMENYLSGRGFAWLYQHFYQQALDAPTIITAWEQGEAQARRHVARYLALLAVCLGNLLTAFDPDIVVLGGGLSRFSWLAQALPENLASVLLPAARIPRIALARHGDAGGMRGAAFLHLTE